MKIKLGRSGILAVPPISVSKKLKRDFNGSGSIGNTANIREQEIEKRF